jgi:hypothetical protein
MHNLWVVSKKVASVADWHTLPCLCPWVFDLVINHWFWFLEKQKEK